MYSMYDNKAEIYNKPLYMKTWTEIEEAVNAMLEQDSEIINPKDYDVFHMGEYDEHNGKYIIYEAPKHVMNLQQLKKDK